MRLNGLLHAAQLRRGRNFYLIAGNIEDYKAVFIAPYQNRRALYAGLKLILFNLNGRNKAFGYDIILLNKIPTAST